MKSVGLLFLFVFVALNATAQTSERATTSEVLIATVVGQQDVPREGGMPPGTESPAMTMLNMFILWPIQSIIDNWDRLPGLALEFVGLFFALLLVVGVYMLFLYPLLMIGSGGKSSGRRRQGFRPTWKPDKRWKRKEDEYLRKYDEQIAQRDAAIGSLDSSWKKQQEEIENARFESLDKRWKKQQDQYSRK